MRIDIEMTREQFYQELLQEAATALHAYLSAGDKPSRKSASILAKNSYKNITGKEYFNPIETMNNFYAQIGISDRICCYCEQDLTMVGMTSEHIVPRSMGGTNLPKNLLCACGNCNGLRGSKTFFEFRHEVLYQRRKRLHLPKMVSMYDKILKNIDIVEDYMMKMGDELLKDKPLSSKYPRYYYELFKSTKK